jgi:hypothetical protein
MTAARPATETVTGRPPKVTWRPIAADQFPLQALLRLLFEPVAGPAEGKGGPDAT